MLIFKEYNFSNTTYYTYQHFFNNGIVPGYADARKFSISDNKKKFKKNKTCR